MVSRKVAHRTAKKPSHVARKAPAQERSQALVSALIRSTARILICDGWQGLTTNRVAEEAGVSVGSLYQYFPNKDALVHAVAVDLAEGMGATILALRTELAGASLAEAIAMLVRAAIEVSRADAPLFRAVLAELPRLGGLEVFERVNRRMVDALAEWIAERRDEVEVSDPSLTAHVIVTALDGLTDHALVFRPELLESARFRRELERLVAGCLGVAAPAPGVRGAG